MVIRCDDDSDYKVYDTGFVADSSSHPHTYQPPGTYSGWDSIARTYRASEPLEYGKHHHWHVAYRYSNGEWSPGSADYPDPHQEFFTVLVTSTRNLGERYVPGEPFDVCLTSEYTGTLTALGIEETIPNGWTFDSVGRDNPPPVYPSSGATGTLSLAWVTPPPSPVDFCYTLLVPPYSGGDESISGEVFYRIGSGSEERTPVLPSPAFISECSYHSGDYNPSDWTFSLSELLRIIQIYNVKAYHCDPAGEDGYNPDTGDQTCSPHDSDYNPANWKISLSELLRAIRLYNIGGYHCDLQWEDGYRIGAPEKSSMGIAAEENLEAHHSAWAYQPWADLTVSVQIEYEGSLKALGMEVDLPRGWTFVSASGSDAPPVVPAGGSTGTLEFAWISAPVTPVEFTYTVHVPLRRLR